MLRRLPFVVLTVIACALSGCGPVERAGNGDVAPDPDPVIGDGGDGGYIEFQRRRHHDMAMAGSPDLASNPDPNPNPNPNGIGPQGGTVSLLHFGVSGDTRPPSCEATQSYPTAIINAIADAFRSRGAQFALDMGDHMYVCNEDLSVATAQMNLYMNAVARFGSTWFMTMGNHECWKGPCLLGSQESNYLAFMHALAPIASRPYYTFDIQTSLGLASFVVVADNAWDGTQAAWLEQTLAAADKKARYTIVARHHPEGDTSVVTNADSMAIIRRHKFALLLTGHSHLYHHMTTDQGRDVVIGMSGAPLIAQGTFYGYGMIDQLQTGELQVSIFDVNDHMLQDQFRVGPN